MKTIDILHRALAARDRLMADERILHAEITGSVRRGEREVNDLDLLIVTNEPWVFHAEPGQRPRNPERDADLVVATPETYGAALAFSTGPHALNRILREKAREQGYLFDFASIRAAAAKEKQLARQVEMNTKLKTLRDELNAARKRL